MKCLILALLVGFVSSDVIITPVSVGNTSMLAINKPSYYNYMKLRVSQSFLWLKSFQMDDVDAVYKSISQIVIKVDRKVIANYRNSSTSSLYVFLRDQSNNFTLHDRPSDELRGMRLSVLLPNDIIIRSSLTITVTHSAPAVSIKAVTSYAYRRLNNHRHYVLRNGRIVEHTISKK